VLSIEDDALNLSSSLLQTTTTVRLKNVSIRRDALRNILANDAKNDNSILNFLDVVSGTIGSLVLVIPWSLITSSDSSSQCEVQMEDVEILLQQSPLASTDGDDEKKRNRKDNEISSLLSDALKERISTAAASESKANAAGTKTPFAARFRTRLLKNCLHNLAVTIKNVHIRYEQRIPGAATVALGLTVRQVLFQSVDENDEDDDFSDDERSPEPLKKLAAIYQFGLYWDPDSNFCENGTDYFSTILPLVTSSSYPYILKPISPSLTLTLSDQTNVVDFSLPR